MGPLMATIEENKWQDRWTGKKFLQDFQKDFYFCPTYMGRTIILAAAPFAG